MILIRGRNKSHNIRVISDFVEPYCVKMLQKKFHTYFVYRCSDYRNFKSLCNLHKFNLEKIDNNIITLIEKYWSAIDIIYLKIHSMPVYSPTVEFFEKFELLRLEPKFVLNINFYEVKVSSGEFEPILSVKSNQFIQELKSFEKHLNVIHISYSGNTFIEIKEMLAESLNYTIRTHYGRLNKTRFN